MKILASYDLPFSRYDNFDFLLEKLFPFKNFTRAANDLLNFKKLLHVCDFQ